MANEVQPTTPAGPSIVPGRSTRPARRGRPKSHYGLQMQEKQNLKRTYGLREGQMKVYFARALNAKAPTGEHLVTLLEQRLDNAIYRAGFAQTRAHARQMASHGLFQVNGRKVTVPSIRLRAEDVVSVKESKRAKAPFTNWQKHMQNVVVPAWLSVDPATFSFTVIAAPTAEEAAVGVNMQAIVEYYARQI